MKSITKFIMKQNEDVLSSTDDPTIQNGFLWVRYAVTAHKVQWFKVLAYRRIGKDILVTTEPTPTEYKITAPAWEGKISELGIELEKIYEPVKVTKPSNITKSINEIKVIEQELENTLKYSTLREKYVTPTKKTFTQAEQRKLFNKARLLINKLADKSIKYVDSLPLYNIFQKSYNKTKAILERQGFTVPSLGQKTPSELSKLKNDFFRAITTNETKQLYTIDQRIKTIESIMNIEKNLEGLQNSINARSDLTPEQKRDIFLKQRNRIFELQKPRYTLLRQTSYFQGLDAEVKRQATKNLTITEQRAFLRTFNNAESKLEARIAIGIDKGYSYSQKMTGINEITQKAFPGGSVIYQKKDGTTGSIPIDHYNEDWLRYGERRMDSLGTLAPMAAANTDTIKWVLVGENHAQISLDVYEGGPYYSISGLSKKYPKLPAMPPLFPNCKCQIRPAESDMMEYLNVLQRDVEEVADVGFITEKEAGKIANG